MQTGAEAIRLLEEREERRKPRHLLFLDADLGGTAANAGPLVGPVRTGQADMTIAVIKNRVKLGGHGIVVRAAGAGIERATGWRPVQPLNGQRCLTRTAFEIALPLAHGWGAETGLTIDLKRKGMRITEVEVDIAHRATGTDLRAQLHRAHQLMDVTRALVTRWLYSLRSRYSSMRDFSSFSSAGCGWSRHRRARDRDRGGGVHSFGADGSRMCRAGP